ncbi:type II CAAX prenyl endopeptidase Rce1 family protein [Pontiella sp.]|uniref:CPBP family glutamic-type intramembrane protease n=1 Tax=Pontiella sp. TaxID=2837462 RepID=UPI003563FCA0
MKLVAAWVPYAAVLLGMRGLGSAWAAILLYHAGIVLFLFLRKSSSVWKPIGRGYGPLLIPAVLLCALAAPAVYFMWPWLASPNMSLPAWLAEYGLTGYSWALLVPWFSVVHPVLEEMHWRGLAPENKKGFCGADFLFAGYHILVLYELVYWPWLFMVFAVLAGSSLFWRRTAERYGGFLLPVLSHAAADAGVMTGVYFLLRS